MVVGCRFLHFTTTANIFLLATIETSLTSFDVVGFVLLMLLVDAHFEFAVSAQGLHVQIEGH